MADDETIIVTFGKYRGKDLEDVPSTYLRWLDSQDWFEKKYPQFLKPVEDELKYRDVHNLHFDEDGMKIK